MNMNGMQRQVGQEQDGEPGAGWGYRTVGKDVTGTCIHCDKQTQMCGQETKARCSTVFTVPKVV